MPDRNIMTAVIHIGNFDSRLSNIQWERYVNDVETMVEKSRAPKHFQGYSAPGTRWQNAVWIIEIEDESSWLDWLATELVYFATKYQQDAIPLTVGLTTFIEPRDT